MGVLGALVGVVGTYIFTVWSDRGKSQQRHKNLIAALLVELRHLDRVMGEIKGDVIDAYGICWKRMNIDVLGNIRVSLAEYGDMVFLELLADTYRDVIHTNEMLDRLVKAWEDVKANDGPKEKQQIVRVRTPTQESIRVTWDSIKKLKDDVEKKYEAL